MAYPNNTARAVFEFTMPNGALGFVTPHFRTFDGSDYTSGDVEALAGLLEDWAVNANFQSETNNSLLSWLADECSLNSITVTSLDPTAPPQFVEAVNSPGTSGLDPMPNETAVVVTLYTGLVGRSFRGRNFWPGFNKNIIDSDGTLSSAALSAIQTTFEALVNGLVDQGDNVLAVNSVTLGQVNQVISVVARDVLHHQRRRNQ